MRTEKTFITQEYVARLNASPFFVVLDYRGLTVVQFTDLRKQLRGAGAELHVVKNSIFRIAAKETGLADLTGALTGQTAVVTGQRDISAAAKVLKKFAADADKGKVKFGYLGNQRLEAAQLSALADLPSLDVLRAKLLGLLQTPAGQLVRTLNEPGSRLARVIKTQADKAA